MVWILMGKRMGSISRKRLAMGEEAWKEHIKIQRRKKYEKHVTENPEKYVFYK